MWIMAKCIFDLIYKNTYIITLLKDMSVLRKRRFMFYINGDTIIPFVRYYVKDVVKLARISTLH
jgi:hypothetical protein